MYDPDQAKTFLIGAFVIMCTWLGTTFGPLIVAYFILIIIIFYSMAKSVIDKQEDDDDEWPH